MATIAKNIIALAAGAAFIFPLSINPNAVQDCNDPSYHFVMSDTMGSTVPDSTNAKDSFCRVVEDYVRLYN